MKFTLEQNKVWHTLFKRQLPEVKKHATKEYLQGLQVLDLPISKMPNLAQLNKAIASQSRWRVVRTPVRYLSDRQWSKHMSHKQFPITNYIRSSKELDFTPEPDMFHDIFGHLPFLMNEKTRQLIEVFSSAYDIAKKKNFQTIAQLWWFTIEFGLVQEKQKFKAFGAGLMSSFGELKNVMSGKVPIRKFGIQKIINKKRAVKSHHKELFVFESVDKLTEELKQFFELNY